MPDRMTKERTHRLFFALWPDQTLVKKLHSLALALRKKDNERVIPASLIHMTLRYVGNVGSTTQNCLEEMADRIHMSQFEFSLDTLGYWKKPRVIWSAPKSWPDTLNELVLQLEQGCQQCGLEAEERMFSPHVTLIRKAKSPASRIRQESLPWHAFDFALVESKPAEQGVIYEVIKRWELD